MQLFFEDVVAAGLAHGPPRLARRQRGGKDAAGMVSTRAWCEREAQ